MNIDPVSVSMTHSTWTAPSAASDADRRAADSPRETPQTTPWWRTLARCLTATHRDLHAPLLEALERAGRCGARPFEVIAGAPFARYGARVTVEHPSEALAAAFDCLGHPWGAPRWLGIRAVPGRGVRVKPYHAVPRLDDRFAVPPEWSADLYPVAASLDGDAVEIYLRKRRACPFSAFASQCLAPFGLVAPAVKPFPAPHDDAFAVGLRRERDRVTAVSLYADWRALPRDEEIAALWRADMEPADLITYELAVAAVRSLGFLQTGTWHAMLAWSVDIGGGWHRAVSLATPPLTS
jgi:hypothetical protein